MPRRSTVSAAEQPPLSLDAITTAAMALIEREGFDALSMRRLGSELGVEAMSLYYYVNGREELLDAIGDRMIAPLAELELEPDWRRACAQFAEALRDIARERSGTFRLLGLKPLDTPGSLFAVERLVAALVDAGFSPPDALAVYRAVASYARGYALAEATGFTVDAAAPQGRRRLRALSADEFPILHGRVDELTALDPDSAFTRGLEALLTGFPDPH
jgi:AcrR family transcriptional regulator